MKHGTISLGRVAGIPVSLHWSVGLIAMLLASSLADVTGWFAASIGVIAFLTSILVHEFAHALMARRFGVETDSIQLWALGGIALLQSESPNARAEGWIAAAGPIASAALAGASLLGWWALGGREASAELVGTLGWVGIINAFLALFNLLPGAPLDGGRILKAIRWARHGDRFRAAREAGAAGMAIGWLMATIGLVLILRSESGVWLMVTGAFVAVNARVEIAGAQFAKRLDGITVGDLTWYGVAAAGVDMDADSMLWQRTRLGAAGGVAVTDAAGLAQGIVLEHELWAIPANDRPWVMLTQMMVPIGAVAQARADEALTAVLPRLNPARPILTVWENGRLVGMVPPARLSEQLARAGV